jgi:hypothetical protein
LKPEVAGIAEYLRRGTNASPQIFCNTAAAIPQYLTADILQYPSFVAC